ncbi:hypothetical protein LJB86_02540 [Deltaproteobacteria bacterium OttesenSCG-928-M10]|nr:hypothetical protein [Deltaproteobacteria bacterium OttesenSCG-928-M10]
MPHNSPEPTDCDQAITWRESRHFDDPAKLPGQIIAGARYREGLTKKVFFIIKPPAQNTNSY